MKKTKYIDINGTGNSGKSTITDLLREFEGVFLYDHLFEFDLIRIQGGLIDLKHNIHDYWSPIRADYAVQRFMKTAKRLSNSNFEQIQSKIESYGTNYEKIFNNKFIEETEKYVNSLVLKTVDRELWPYRLIDKSFFYLFFYKFFRKLRLEKIIFSKSIIYNITDNESFLKLTQNYIDHLFSNIYGRAQEDEVILLQNTLEPYNSINGIELFSNIKVINIIRDPRDIFASTLNNDDVYVPEFINTKMHWNIKREFLNTKNIEDFINIQRMNFKNISKNNNILILKYEDIVLDYDNVLKQICIFLDISESKHILRKKYFDPEKSKKNIGLWKKFQDLPEIKLIEKELAEYCYQK